RSVGEVIVFGQNQPPTEKKPELHLITYLVEPYVYQIGMNGVVFPRLSANNFSEEIEIEEIPKLEVPENQLELPLFKEERWYQFQRFYGSGELADWAINRGLKHPGELHRADIVAEMVTELPRSLTRLLVFGQYKRNIIQP